MAAALTCEYDIEKIEPFARIRNDVGNIYNTHFLERVEVHFEWLDEILEEARKAFQTTPEVELLPKTPSEKRKRGRGRQKNDGSVRKSSASRRGSNRSNASVRKSTRFLKVKAAILDLGGAESGVESDGDDPAANEHVDQIDHENPPIPGCPQIIIEDFGAEEMAIAGAQNMAMEHVDGPVEEQSDDFVDAQAEFAEDVPAIVVENATEINEGANVEGEGPRSNEEIENGANMEEDRPKSALSIPEEPVNYKTPEPAVRGKALAAPSSNTQQKSLLPVPKSGAKQKSSTPSVLTPRTTPTQPINRCYTPKSGSKLTGAETRDRLKQQMAEATAKREELLKQKIEEQKKKREDRALKVAQQRLKQKAIEDEMKRKIEEKYNTPAMDLEEKRKLRPRFPESGGAKKADNERAQLQEKEKAKEKERIQREQAELQRVDALERERQQQKCSSATTSTATFLPVQATPKMVSVDAKIQNLEANGQSTSTATKSKHPEQFHLPPLSAIAKVVVVPSLTVTRETFNVSKPSTSAANQSQMSESYDMTPLRQMKPPTATNYDISDLRSSDETDDDEHPRKKIPTWAQGGQLKVALTQQYYGPPDLDELFGVVDMPDLATMFKFQKKRFYKRTSSAKWDSPIRPHSSVSK